MDIPRHISVIWYTRGVMDMLRHISGVPKNDPPKPVRAVRKMRLEVDGLKKSDPDLAFLYAYGFCDTHDELKCYFPEWSEEEIENKYREFRCPPLARYVAPEEVKAKKRRQKSPAPEKVT